MGHPRELVEKTPARVAQSRLHGQSDTNQKSSLTLTGKFSLFSGDQRRPAYTRARGRNKKSTLPSICTCDRDLARLRFIYTPANVASYEFPFWPCHSLALKSNGSHEP